jgi:hypothetical protein
MDVVSTDGLGSAGAALSDEAVSLAAGSPDADRLAAASVAALARSAAVQAADFMEAAGSMAVAEATVAGIAKTSD